MLQYRSPHAQTLTHPFLSYAELCNSCTPLASPTSQGATTASAFFAQEVVLLTGEA